MPRPHRKDPDGGIHHITNHRAGDDDLFLTDRDRLLFLLLMEAARKETGVEILAYCLMGNHYHIVLHCPHGQLDRFVHYLQGNYARAFNHRHNHQGPVFRRRYHSVLITTNGQLLFTVRYVHRNPLELGIDIRTYPWSDYPAYCGNDVATSGLVTTTSAMVLQQWGNVTAYRDDVETDLDHDKARIRTATRRVHFELPPPVRDRLTYLCDIVADLTGSDRSSITSGNKRARSDARLLAVFVARSYFDYEQPEVCSFFGFTNSTTLRTTMSRARRRYAQDQDFASLVDLVRNRWLAGVPVAAA